MQPILKDIWLWLPCKTAYMVTTKVKSGREMWSVTDLFLQIKLKAMHTFWETANAVTELIIL